MDKHERQTEIMPVCLPAKRLTTGYTSIEIGRKKYLYNIWKESGQSHFIIFIMTAIELL